MERNGRPVDLEGLWWPCPAFLVGTGPGIADRSLGRELLQRGVLSLAVNNAAAWVPARAWVFGDPQSKFHHALFLDPAMMTFAPKPKMGRRIVAKEAAAFRSTNVRVGQCPNTFCFDRAPRFVPDEFFSTPYAHWGAGKQQPENVKVPGGFCTIFLGLRLLHYLGVRRVYLLGVDHRREEGGAYGFPDSKRFRKGFRKERKLWELLRPVFDRYGMEVYSCSESFDLFPHVEFHRAVEDCRGSIPDEPLDTVGWNDKAEVLRQCGEHPPLVPRHFER